MGGNRLVVAGRYSGLSIVGGTRLAGSDTVDGDIAVCLDAPDAAVDGIGPAAVDRPAAKVAAMGVVVPGERVGGS